MINGGVFQESGYALPDATATLVAETPAEGTTAKVPKAGKTQNMEAISDSRGEFIFHPPVDTVRVPRSPAQYSIVVTAKGYHSVRKSVAVQGYEHVEVTFQLERESK